MSCGSKVKQQELASCKGEGLECGVGATDTGSPFAYAGEEAMRMTPKLRGNMDALTNATSRDGEQSITRGRMGELLERIKDIVDDSPARLNRVMTRRQAWGIFSDCANVEKPDDVLSGLIFKNIVAEFGENIISALAAGRKA